MSEDHAMHRAPERVRMTYDDLLALPDDGLRHELIDGEHIVSPSPGSAHQLIVGNLYLLLRTFLKDHPLGIAMLAPFDIVFSQYDVVEPDLIYFSMDPKLETLKVYQRGGEAFQKAGELSVEANDSLTTPLLPGLSLPLVSIFERP